MFCDICKENQAVAEVKDRRAGGGTLCLCKECFIEFGDYIGEDEDCVN